MKTLILIMVVCWILMVALAYVAMTQMGGEPPLTENPFEGMNHMGAFTIGSLVR